MFTRKLLKAGIAACSLILIAATPGSHLFTLYRDTASATNSTHLSDSACKELHSFDSSGFCSCLSCLSAEEQINAPRIQLHKQASGFVRDYLGENGFFLEKIRAKSIPYFEVIDAVFRKYEVPVELKYLAVIESKLNSQAVSGAGAAGLWQLMPVAAKKFGLKVGGKNDERKNVYKSTEAGAKCLLYLHRMFDDWLLTVAAYNCGPGGVLKAIKRSGSRDFWVLQNFLPLETRKHVKRFIAIHYFFEGHGSLATLTKKETNAHIDSVAAFLKKRERQRPDTLVANSVAVQPTTR